MIFGSKTFPWRSVEDLAARHEIPFLIWQPRKYWSPGRVLFPRPAHAWVKPIPTGQLKFDGIGEA